MAFWRRWLIVVGVSLGGCPRGSTPIAPTAAQPLSSRGSVRAAAPGGGRTGTELPPAVPALARDIARWTNVERLGHGVRPLIWSPRLARAARAHSEEMARLGYFSHDSPRPGRRTVLQRVRLAGVRSRPIFVGENIGRSTPWPHQARRFVQSWMDSPAHRSNLLRPNYRYLGIGVASAGRWIIATQVFSTTDR